MNPPTNRPLTLKDVMVLVAATAVGIAWARGGWDWMYLSRLEVTPAIAPSWRPVEHAARALPSALPCLATWTMALLVLRLSRPRPRLRRVVLQPGAAACIAAVLSLAIGAADFALSSVWWWVLRGECMPWDAVPTHSMEYLFQAAGRTAVAIVSLWTILAVSHRCRPEATWIDRLGRVLGALWIVLAVCRGWAELAHVMGSGTSSVPASAFLRALLDGYIK